MGHRPIPDRRLRDGRVPVLQSLGAMAESGGPWPPAADWSGPSTAEAPGRCRREMHHRRAVASLHARPRCLGVTGSASVPVGRAVLPAAHPAALCGSRPADQHSQMGGWLPLIFDHTLALPMRGNALQFRECSLTRVNKLRSEIAVDHASGRRRRLDGSTRRPNGGFGTSSTWPPRSSTTCVV